MTHSFGLGRFLDQAGNIILNRRARGGGTFVRQTTSGDFASKDCK